MRRTWSFAAKLVGAALLGVLADFLFYGTGGASTVGVFAAAWALWLLLAVRPVRRRPGALTAALLGLLFGGLLINDPSLLGWLLFWSSVASAALLTRRRFDDALSWAARLMLHVPLGLIRPFGDLRGVLRAWTPDSRRLNVAALLSIVAVPAIGGALFLALFAAANPIIAGFFNAMELPDPAPTFLHALLWAVVFIGVWPSFRPHPRATGTEIGTIPIEGLMPNIPIASTMLSLLTFNAIFAVQNALDVAFLWSRARLPGTITLADYAHRGAFTLMASALLAGLFVLIVLRPGTPSARRPGIRLLVALWIGQTLLLVASCVLRMLDYVAGYSLTDLRIWALAWMVLVGVGLALICWRLLRGKSTGWLINTNALAAGLVLTLGSAVDPAEIAASWNVDHARETGGGGQPIDLCYLYSRGPSSLLAAIELERRVSNQPQLLDRARAVRALLMDDIVSRQSEWHSWTWRNARRLEAAQALLGPHAALPASVPNGRACDGSPNPDVEPAPPVEAASEANEAAPAPASNEVAAAHAASEMLNQSPEPAAPSTPQPLTPAQR